MKIKLEKRKINTCNYKFIFNFREKLNLSSIEKGSSDNISTIIIFLRPIQDIIKGNEIIFMLVLRLFCTKDMFFVLLFNKLQNSQTN